MLFTHTCPQCQTFFTTSNRKSIHCSRSCAAKTKSTQTARTCQECGKGFSVPAGRLKHSACLWCSDRCRHSSAQWKRSLKPVRTQEFKCEICSKPFMGHVSDIGRKKFCSKACLGKANGKRFSLLKTPDVYNNCKECGKPYKVYCASYADRSFFCSKACNALYHGRHKHIMRPTSIETALQTALTRLGVAFTPELRAGRYCIDIALETAKIAVEADGDYWHSLPKQITADAKKNAFLKSQGWTVVRFTETEINADPDKCAKQVHAMIQA